MKKIILTSFVFLSPLLAHEGHEHATEKKSSHQVVAKEMTEAASSFLAILDEAEKKRARFDFSDDERENFHFVPRQREGVRLDTLAIEKQHLAHALLASGLSHKGYLTANQIMSLEAYLALTEKSPDFRNPGKYFLTIFGTPAAKGLWGWRFEGHHLSINLSLVDGRIQDSPAFFGTNPAEIKEGPRKGQRPLGDIEDAARIFATELHAAGRKVVFTEKAPHDIITGSNRNPKALAAEGVHSEKLNDSERTKLFSLFKIIYALQRGELSANELKKLREQDEKKITFAWGGSLEAGQAHYFRLQSPDILIEYANTQNNANHAHLTFRHLHDDFGRDLLKEHYEHDHEK